MDERLKAILELRRLSERFVAGDLSFEQFLPALGWHSFDDEDDEGRYEPRETVKDLAQEIQTEYLFYVKWRLAAAAGTPKSEKWVYGQSSEPYGWIDKQEYRRRFSDEFLGLHLIPIAVEE